MMVTTLSIYSSIANNLARYQTATSNDPTVKQATATFNANIGKVKTASDLINNFQLFTYAMKAFGLGDMTYAKGLMTQVLKQGVTSSTALANTLHNPNIKAFATAFDFVKNGAKTTSSASLISSVNKKYVEQALEANQGQSNTAVQLALNFAQLAPNLADAYGILADKNLLTVVQTTLGLPAASSAQDITTQFAEISKKINVTDFKSQAKLNAFIARFCAQADLNGQNTGSSATNGALPAGYVSPLGNGANASTGLPNNLVSPLMTSSTPSGTTFSTDLILSLQNLKLG